LNAAPDRWRWLDRVPWVVIAVVTVFLVPAPFMPEPHLWEKLKMLAAGTLVRPIDIFDLFWHGAPLVLLSLKIWRKTQLAQGSKK
jgi:hypothetical protein